MRRLILLLPLLAACDGAIDPGEPFARGQRWLQDPVLRRDVLEAALVSWDNGYARTRLERYTEGDWGARPEWRPRIALATTQTIAPSSFELAVQPGFQDEEGLVALGRAAFSRYPVQVVPELREALATPSDCGLDVEGGVVRGVVWVELPDGPQPALTCEACHAEVGGLGRPNRRFDLGAVLSGRCDVPSRWGPGRVDVTPDQVDNPTAIPDLRPVRWHRFLHRAATLLNDRLALAMRTETLIITSLSTTVRPPREVALGLSWFMWGLAEGLPPAPPDREEEALFATHCGQCHGGEGFGGGVVELKAAATDLAVLDSPARGTGQAKVPSLRGLADRGRLFSGGAAADLEAYWDRGVQGHPGPESVPAASRARLLGYLRSL